MSASLMVLIPLALVGIVGTLCFIGCGFPTFLFDSGYEALVRNTDNLVAFWPLHDPQDSTTAVDVAPKPSPFNGTYTGSVVAPGQLGLLPTAVFNNAVSTCAFFNGGFVSIPFQQALNPAGSFTLECWVKPGWTTADTPALRAVVVSATSAGAGYALFAQADNVWEAQIGTGNGNFFALKAKQAIALNADAALNPVTYLAVTLGADGQLTLSVGIAGGVLTSVSDTPKSKFVAEDSTAMPSTATPLFIGTGHPDATPGNPFNGFIQDVAFYSPALSSDTLIKHFQGGTTNS